MTPARSCKRPPLPRFAFILVLVLLSINGSTSSDALNVDFRSVVPDQHSCRRRRFWRSSPPCAPRIVSLPINVTDEDIHNSMMAYALEEARQAGAMGEVPIGAVVVREFTAQKRQQREKDLAVSISTPDENACARYFEVLSTGRNLVETKMDATAHAEIEAMKRASSRVQNWRLLNTTLYSTLEPCPMCLAAAQAFRCKLVVYGAPDLRLGAVETHIQLLQMAKHPYHNLEAIGGVREDQSASLLRDFFRSRRGRSKDSPSSAGTPSLKSPISGIMRKVNDFFGKIGGRRIQNVMGKLFGRRRSYR